MTNKLIEYLSGFVSERRLKLFDSVLDLRTRYMTVVLEDIFQPHNASAVLRSCECFGIQDIHIIENKNPYRISPDVALGSYKWLNLYRYNKDSNNTIEALSSLKAHGYRIIATSPHKKNSNLEDFDIPKGKFALTFGSELNGLTSNALGMADEFLKIPMSGFTESLNISVTAAICIHYLSGKIRSDNDLEWHLNDEEKQDIKLTWLKNSIRKSELIIKTFLEQHG
ncbi:MAG TPA: RNA methyltransferase [Bacteroidales bacterium]|nr:RNA methyltransferase [Bacteroidales bacterium]